VKQAVTSCVQPLDTDFFYAAIQALMPWEEKKKSLNVNDNYMESGVYHLLHMCHVNISEYSSWNKCILLYFLNVLNNFGVITGNNNTSCRMH